MNDIKPKLLCVDDDPTVLAALIRLLEVDFTVLSATCASDAMGILAKESEIAILLTDHRMPGITGVELLGHCKIASENTVRALLSAQIDIEEMVDAINTGKIHRFILKPWDNHYLRLQMREALAAHKLLLERRALEALSVSDSLTHLKNHRYFQDQLKIEVERAERHGRSVSLLMVDIDHFKAFNDQFGHPAGDRILFAISRRLESQVRNIDTVARYGGEEFAIILPDTDNSQAAIVAERIRAAFEHGALPGPDGRAAFVTVSSGIASFPANSTSAQELIQAADNALYQAKRQGRNQSVGA